MTDNETDRGDTYNGVFLCGPKMMTIQFPDKTRHAMYSAELRAIHALNEDILNAMEEGEGLSAAETHRRISGWLEMVTTFANRWTLSLVASDIRKTWRNAEILLGRVPTLSLEEIDNIMEGSTDKKVTIIVIDPDKSNNKK